VSHARDTKGRALKIKLSVEVTIKEKKIKQSMKKIKVTKKISSN
jgi:hypothetical protein